MAEYLEEASHVLRVIGGGSWLDGDIFPIISC